MLHFEDKAHFIVLIPKFGFCMYLSIQKRRPPPITLAFLT